MHTSWQNLPNCLTCSCFTPFCSSTSMASVADCPVASIGSTSRMVRVAMSAGSLRTSGRCEVAVNVGMNIKLQWQRDSCRTCSERHKTTIMTQHKYARALT